MWSLLASPLPSPCPNDRRVGVRKPTSAIGAPCVKVARRRTPNMFEVFTALLFQIACADRTDFNRFEGVRSEQLEQFGFAFAELGAVFVGQASSRGINFQPVAVQGDRDIARLQAVKYLICRHISLTSRVSVGCETFGIPADPKFSFSIFGTEWTEWTELGFSSAILSIVSIVSATFESDFSVSTVASSVVVLSIVSILSTT